jgi:Tol biopolymer transport system component
VPTIISGLITTPAAYAHQEQPDPYDLWQIAADGAGLKRVAKVQQRQASIAWSPDGRRIAVRGDLGLQIVEAETGKTSRLNDEVGYGPFDWVP